MKISIKIFLLFIILIILQIIQLSKSSSDFSFYKYRYDSCNEKWANESLWSNSLTNTESTICQDDDLKSLDIPTGFVALMANIFAHKKISCSKSFDEKINFDYDLDVEDICNPLTLNRLFKECIFYGNLGSNDSTNGLFNCIGLKQMDINLKINDVESYVYDGYILLASENKNSTDLSLNRFLIEGIYDNFYIRGLDYRGKNILLHYSQAANFEVFKLMKRKGKKNKKKNKNRKNNNINDYSDEYDKGNKKNNDVFISDGNIKNFAASTVSPDPIEEEMEVNKDNNIEEDFSGFDIDKEEWEKNDL